MKNSFCLQRFSILIFSLIVGMSLVAIPATVQARSDDLIIGAIEQVGKRTHRDMVIVDKDEIIVADAIRSEVGKKFLHDSPGEEVDKTLEDGKTRTFVEKSKDYPKGIKQTVYAIKDDDGDIIGAVIVSVPISK